MIFNENNYSFGTRCYFSHKTFFTGVDSRNVKNFNFYSSYSSTDRQNLPDKNWLIYIATQTCKTAHLHSHFYEVHLPREKQTKQ